MRKPYFFLLILLLVNINSAFADSWESPDYREGQEYYICDEPIIEDPDSKKPPVNYMSSGELKSKYVKPYLGDNYIFLR